jgi:hypothetical protein
MKHGRTALPTILALAFTLLAPQARAVSHVKQRLTSTGKDLDARGRAVLVVRGSRGRLTIAAKRLAGQADYEVIVDGVRIGALSTGPSGAGKARFTTGSLGAQLLGVDPRGKLVEVRDRDGDDVLETKMPDDEAGEVRCCVADEDETECEHETPERCAAKGGVDMGTGSCMPNPCAPGSGDRVRCCIPEHDEDGPECEDLTSTECGAQGGVSIGAGECDDHACAPTPPGEEEIRCCLADDHDDGGLRHHHDSGEDDQGEDGEDDREAPDCERLTAGACSALGGRDLGAGSCEPNPCAASPSGAFLDPVAP